MKGSELIKALQDAIKLGGDGEVSLTVSMLECDFTVETENKLIVTNNGNEINISHQYS